MNNLYNENYKALENVINVDIRRWKAIPCSWIHRINIVKMATLRKEVYVFNEIPIKIPMTFFTKMEKSILKFYGSTKEPQ
jgi:hypothetical protein